MNVRTVFGVLAWMMSSSLDASEVSSLIAISADGNPTTYLLSEVQRINVSANDIDGTMSIISKDGYEYGSYQKIIFASVTTKICGVNVPNVYVYPNPVSNILYINGVLQQVLTEKMVLMEKQDILGLNMQTNFLLLLLKYMMNLEIQLNI